MSQKNQPVTEERLKEVLKNYPDKDYLEERLDLLKQEIGIELNDRFENFEEKLDEKLSAFEKRFYKALGTTVVNHEQRITKLEETVDLTR